MVYVELIGAVRERGSSGGEDETASGDSDVVVVVDVVLFAKVEDTTETVGVDVVVGVMLSETEEGATETGDGVIGVVVVVVVVVVGIVLFETAEDTVVCV